jgi:hypothetical protein
MCMTANPEGQTTQPTSCEVMFDCVHTAAEHIRIDSCARTRAAKPLQGSSTARTPRTCTSNILPYTARAATLPANIVLKCARAHVTGALADSMRAAPRCCTSTSMAHAHVLTPFCATCCTTDTQARGRKYNDQYSMPQYLVWHVLLQQLLLSSLPCFRLPPRCCRGCLAVLPALQHLCLSLRCCLVGWQV